MGRLMRLAWALAGLVGQVSATACGAETVADWRPLTGAAADRFGLPLAWIERVMADESGGRTRLRGRPIVSPAGAMGLMQLMPATWSAMRVRLGLGRDPHDPRDNIVAGAGYLRLLYDRFGYPGLFAAYNAGPARYAAYRAGRALPPETRRYLAAVAGTVAVGRHPVIASPAVMQRRRGVFAIVATGHGAARDLPDDRGADALFAVRSPR